MNITYPTREFIPYNDDGVATNIEISEILEQANKQGITDSKVWYEKKDLENGHEHEVIAYVKDGKLHRQSGPAVEIKESTGQVMVRAYYVNGELNRGEEVTEKSPSFKAPRGVGYKAYEVEGPAYSTYYPNGNLQHIVYYVHGKKHNPDGPAEQYLDEEGNVLYLRYQENGVDISRRGLVGIEWDKDKYLVYGNFKEILDNNNSYVVYRDRGKDKMKQDRVKFDFTLDSGKLNISKDKNQDTTYIAESMRSGIVEDTIHSL